MVGLIHRLLFDLLESKAGADAVRQVKSRAGVPEDRQFRLDEAYDDGEWQRLFEAACEVTNLPAMQVEETFAGFFVQDALLRWPTWFQMSANAREFLERQPRIHNGFATGVQDSQARDAINDKFRLDKFERRIVMHYCSQNRMCGLYRALARRIIDHYGDDADVQETKCLKNGDSECEIHVTWN